ncbi:hypothetical protein ACFX2J_023480 [Malus domestica]|uniref:probable WRKY transcription factor 3 n=1 Tax=Malus domestica TaxID=3750 RepID=UPI0039754ADF
MTAKTQDSNRVAVSAPPPQKQPQRPVITLPPRPSAEALFSGGSGASPGPMTLVSSFFENYPESDFRSFSQLLAGAMGSPVGSTRGMNFFSDSPADGLGKSGGGSEYGGEGSSGFKQSRPMSLAVARPPLFTVPPGLSPSGLLNSPGFYSPQSPFGMSHQQALAQVTAQAALAQSRVYMQPDYQPSSVAAPTEPQACQPSLMPEEASRQLTLPSTSDTKSYVRQSSEASHSDGKYQPSSTGRPADDSYNWRKYGQKLVKGSEFPRSYYKCTHMNCPVKKKVERIPSGEITEIIYKGQHNHEVPQPSKRPKDGDLNGPKPENGLQRRVGDSNRLSENVASQSQPERDQESTEAASGQLPGGIDNEELGDGETREEGDADEPNAKRRNIDVGTSEVGLAHKMVTEPKIIVQTRSEVDLLDDGYRWRKYGQKVVKGNPHPRSYYKCTFAGCNVRKHVERASTDAEAVITTYEGKHNHDVPAARNSSHSTANNSASLLKPPASRAPQHTLQKGREYGNNVQRPVLLQLKEEQIVV